MSELLDHLSAALTGRYTVERELGRGGMALVFLAQDLKHHRPVAIKVLRPELAAVLGAERFLREIETAAKLTHPHILPLHDSGEASGFLYYVMPYVEGESLRDRLAREKQLPLEDALQIAREVADALSYAHSHDVIHRDIKPENILFEAGHAVVTDFGIARAITAAGGEKLTETGIAVGTPAYMSPEQAGGSRELDGRSDLYSLGCVLYEMLAGQPPFTGPTVESVVHQHLTAEPPSVTSIRPAVPAAVVAALARALAKTPADRFNPVAQFAEALRPAVPAAWAPSPPAPSRRWRLVGVVGGGIALLLVGGWLGSRLLQHQRPQAGFAARRPYTIVAEIDGTAPQDVRSAARNVVMEALDQSGVIATLPDDQLRLGLQLAGRPDSARLDLATARELAVRGAIRTVVAGTIDRVGVTYHVGVRVLEADSGAVVAAGREVARGDDDLIPTVDRVMRALRTDFGERSDAIAANRPLEQAATPSFEAYKRYMRARELHLNGDYVAAVPAYQGALALDPDFAAAWRGLGAVYSSVEKDDSALLAVNEALARPGRLTEAQRLWAEGDRALYSGDDEAAADAYWQEYRQYGDAGNLNDALDNLGRTAEAVALLNEEERSSPFGLRPINRFIISVFSTTLGRYDDARRWAATLTGGFQLRALLFLADRTGDWAAAESLGTELLKLARGNERWRAQALTGLGSARAARGRVGEAVAHLRGSARPLARWAILILTVASGSPIVRSEVQTTRTDTTAGGRLFTALWAAGADDTVFARRALAEVQNLPVDRRRGLDGEAVLVEAWLAAAAGRTSDVIRLLQPLGKRGAFRFPPINQLTRWTLADAYERVGQLDSAAVQLERVAAWQGFWSHEALLRGLTHSFAHRRLVLLYAKMGRLDDARRHWKIFSETFTNPDPELVPLVEEAREALRRAERGRG